MSMSRRVFTWVVLLAFGMTLAISVPNSAQEQNAGVVKNPTPTEFIKVPGVPDCLTAAPQHGDPGKGPSTLLLKGSAGCAVPSHWHTANEQLMMVSGIGQVQMKGDKLVLLRPGGFAFAPSHHVHRFSCSGPCMAYLQSDAPFDIHYVDEAGKEIPPEAALKFKAKREAKP
jgi:quercetin dioxygenase-like cupin family protein